MSINYVLGAGIAQQWSLGAPAGKQGGLVVMLQQSGAKQ
jgi:hypothetical protein